MRPGWDEHYVGELRTLSLRGTCPRRQCSAIIVDEEHNRLSDGYNGSPRGLSHCSEEPCPGVDQEKGDTSKCEALHAEENAVIHLKGQFRFANKIYCSNLPCFKCCKMILQTPIKIVVFAEDYADKSGIELLRRGGVEVYKTNDGGKNKFKYIW